MRERKPGRVVLPALVLMLLCAACAPQSGAESGPVPPAEAGGALLELLSGLTGEDISSFEGLLGHPQMTEEELAELIRAAAAHPVDHRPFTGDSSETDAVWSMSVFLAEAASGIWYGGDALYLEAGLEENIVQVFGGDNLPEGTVWLEDEALYQLLRTRNDDPAVAVDQEAYEKIQTAADEYLNREMPDYASAGVTASRELVGLSLVGRSDALGAELYRLEDAYRIDPPEMAPQLLAGGALVDSQLRIHTGAAYLVLADGEAAGYLSWEQAAGGLDQFSTQQELLDAVTPEPNFASR